MTPELDARPLVRAVRRLGPEAGLGWFLGPAAARAAVARAGGAPVRFLGSGLFGTAYLLPSGRVLKFTDAAELAAALRMSGFQEHPNLATVRDAFAVRGRMGCAAAVVRDAVDFPLCDGPRWIDPLVGVLFASAERTILSYRRTDREMRERGWTERRMAREVMRRFAAHARAARLGSARLRSIRDGIVAGVEELLRRGIPDDTTLNTENIGLKDGRAVIFDITTPGFDGRRPRIRTVG